MLAEEAKEFLSVPKRHPWMFAAAYVPVVAAVVVGSTIYKPTFAFCLPMLWGFFVSLFLIQGVKTGRLTDNYGTAFRHQTAFRFWVKFSIWSGFYAVAIVWCIGFALQEKEKSASASPASKAVPVRTEFPASAAGHRVQSAKSP